MRLVEAAGGVAWPVVRDIQCRTRSDIVQDGRGWGQDVFPSETVGVKRRLAICAIISHLAICIALLVEIDGSSVLRLPPRACHPRHRQWFSSSNSDAAAFALTACVEYNRRQRPRVCRINTQKLIPIGGQTTSHTPLVPVSKSPSIRFCTTRCASTGIACNMATESYFNEYTRLLASRPLAS